MMKFDSHGGISIFELVIYVPAIVVAAIVCSRHGFGRSAGWLYTLILCLVRIVGACCQLATYHSETRGLLEAVIILDSIGISPLLLATLGLLSRCADSVSKTSSGLFNAIHFRILQLLIVVALILCIVGGTNSTSSTGAYQPQATTKAGVLLYLLALIVLTVIAVVLAFKLSNAPSDDRKLVWVVLVALPFIAIRIVYSIISVFAHNRHFSLITGSVVIHVFMSVVEEMIVVIIYLAVGWTINALSPADRGPIANRPWKGNLASGGRTEGNNGIEVTHVRNGGGLAHTGNGEDVVQGGNLGGGVQGGNREVRPKGRNKRKTRQGPIHALVGAGIAAAQRRKEDKAAASQP